MTKQKLAAYIPEKWEPRQGLALDAPIGPGPRGGWTWRIGSWEFIGSTEDVDRLPGGPDRGRVEPSGTTGRTPSSSSGTDYKQPAIGKALKVWKEPGQREPAV